MPYNKLFINLACSVCTKKTSVRYFSVQTSRSVNKKLLLFSLLPIWAFQWPITSSISCSLLLFTYSSLNYLSLQQLWYYFPNCVYPNPPYQVALWEETGALWENPQHSFTWIEPITSGVKGGSSDDSTTKAPNLILIIRYIMNLLRMY